MSLIERLKRMLGGSSNGRTEERRPRPSARTASEMISCEEASRRVHEFLDGELDDVPADQVRKHFDVCQGCYPHLQLEQVFRDSLRERLRGETAPDELKSRITTLIRGGQRRERLII